MAWLLAFVTGYFALSVIGVSVLIGVQALIFLLFEALGWLPADGQQERNDSTPRP